MKILQYSDVNFATNCISTSKDGINIDGVNVCGVNKLLVFFQHRHREETKRKCSPYLSISLPILTQPLFFPVATVSFLAVDAHRRLRRSQLLPPSFGIYLVCSVLNKEDDTAKLRDSF